VRAAYIEAPGAPGTVILGELPDPAAGPGEVRLRVHAAGIGPWDCKAMAGMFGKLTLPYAVGFEFAGTVDQVGEGVTDIALGDEVYGTEWRAGSLAEYRVAEVTELAKKPRKFTFGEAAALPVAGTTALEGLVERLDLRADETVIITAASGGVGTLAVQVAHNVGARVIAVASKENWDYVRALGADEVHDYHDGGWVAQVRESYPDGVDALFDCAGRETLTAAFEAVKDGGRAVGIVYGGPEAGPRGISFERFSAGSGHARLAELAQMADDGKLRVELAAELPLASAREALERVAGGHTRGKVVVSIN
jgi:NADPH2:quinone reductase